MGKMGKIPRGACYRPKTEDKVKKPLVPGAPPLPGGPPPGAVVFFKGKKATRCGVAGLAPPPAARPKAADAAPKPSAPSAPSARAVAVAGKGFFNTTFYRMWKYSEVMEIDADIRKGLRDEEKGRVRSGQILRRAARDAKRQSEAGPLNKAISDFASEKQLEHASKALARLEAITKPTVYTLSGIVNACVRCGDLEHAVGYVMRSEEAWGVVPNEVVLTALMKGLCGGGYQREATQLLLSLKALFGADPNERMATTLLRGCMRNTDGRSALLTLAKLKELGWDLSRNEAAVEYTIKALSADGMLSQAGEWLVNGKANASASVSLATASLLLAQPDLGKAALEAAKSGCDESAKLRFKKFQAGESDANKGWDRGGERRSASAAMFNRLRDSETLSQISRLEDIALQVTPLNTLPPSVTTYKTDPTVVFLPLPPLPSAAKLMVKATSEAAPATPTVLPLDRFADPNLPLKIEVCSGHGEWVVERAASEIGKANWMGVEIRPDRVYSAWTRRRQLGAKAEPKGNLLLVCGDAFAFLDSLPEGRVHDLFINYPEPPGSMDSPHNLLNEEFFRKVHRCLLPGGAVTLMSDHALYSAATALRLVKLSREGMYYSSLPPGNGLPLSTDVPTDYGSSYFDRMWLNGKRTKRFFFHFVKPTDLIAAQLKGLDLNDDDAPEAGSDREDDAEDDADDYPHWTPAPKRRRVVYVDQ
eukprot:TRINITY_DN30173_c0_g1_i1.p1 TRINITY_DN30173_c0_g1~~TRINITY_DN30173_c0_g1_i1.p1  ORF type:complete len:704 (+),score=255.82 TRINITY_DN30173_c0_g1_i1:66-2177(+)